VTLEELHLLRHQLPPFGEGAKPSAELLAFCRYYGIEFGAQLAHLIPELEHLAGHIVSGEHRIAVQCWRQPDAQANLFIVHGYYDHTGLFGRLVEWGLRQRCNVVIFDLPGHGLSSGEPAVIDDFGDYSQALDAVLARVRLPALPVWVMGQSTGCAALIDYASNYEWPFDATVLLAPLIRPASWGGVRVAHRLLKGFIPSIARVFSPNSSDAEFLTFIKQDPLQCHLVPLRWITALKRWLAKVKPIDLGVGGVLIIQGDFDGTVDWRYNVPFVEKLFPGSQVNYIEGAGHQLANESDELREAYLAIVKDYLKTKNIDFAGKP